MGTYKVIQTETASNDIYNITFYISKKLKNPDAAKRFAIKVDAEVATLSYLPYRYSNTFWNYNGKEIRLKPFSSYNICYMIDEDKAAVYVLGISYYKQDIEKFFDKRNMEVDRMEVKETVFDYNYAPEQKVKINEFEMPQYIKEMIDRGLKDIAEGRVMEHKKAMKSIRKKLGFDEE